MDSSPALNLPKVDFKPRRLGHVNLFVGDLEELTSFYTEVAGIELVRRVTAPWVIQRLPAARIAIARSPGTLQAKVFL